MSNSTCFSPKAPQEGPPLFQHGNIVFQAHHVGWIVTGFFAILATITSFWLVNKHLQWYTDKLEQRYIVRILFMVPIYALISFASYLFWNHSTPLLLIRDGYESTVLTSFFYLLLTYISPLPDEQKAIFLKVGLSRQADREARRKGEKVRKWVTPLSFVKAKPADGLYFLQLMKWGVLQYCVIRPTTTLAAVVLNYFGWYCNDSLSPRWAHVYITFIVSVSVSIAMYCLIQLYMPVAPHLAPHKPILKLFAVKSVVFLTFWQACLLSGLSMFGVVKDTQYMTADDINTGLSAILETFEMMLFAFIHIRAFSYKPYRPPYHPNMTGFPPPIRTPRLRSLGHAFDFRETFREIWTGCVYISDRMRGVEPRPDMGARRMAMMYDIFGHAMPRNTARDGAIRHAKNSGTIVEVRKEVDVNVDVEGERQWLGLGDNCAYGLGYASRREKSDGLGEAIEKELDRRGVPLRNARVDRTPMGTHHDGPEQPQGRDRRSQRSSWWRSMCNRISQSGVDPADERFTKPSRRNSGSRHHSRELDHTSLLDEYDDPPPLSIIHANCSSRQSRESRTMDMVASIVDASKQDMSLTQPHAHAEEPSDVLTPLPASKRHLTPPRGTINTSLIQSPSTFDRSDSLLARVFPYGSPAMSSTELGSVASESIHSPGARATAELHLMAHSSVVITPGNNPGRALTSSPVPVQMSVDYMGDTNVDTIAHPEQSLPLAKSVDAGIIPPIPSKSGPHGSKRHKPPRHPDERHSPWSQHRESAGHRASDTSSSRPLPMPSRLADTNRTAPRAGDQINGSFDAMNLYMAQDDTRRMRRGPKPTIRLDPLAQYYPMTDQASPPAQGNSSPSHSGFNAVSPSYQDADRFQQPAIPANPSTQMPSLTRSTYTHSSLGTRSRRRMSLPVENAPQPVTRPPAARSRNGYRSRRCAENANVRQLTVPALLAPLLPKFDGIPIHSTSEYDPSGPYNNVKHITNSLPLAEV